MQPADKSSTADVRSHRHNNVMPSDHTGAETSRSAPRIAEVVRTAEAYADHTHTMPGLVNRYHVSAEYAELLSTTPTRESGSERSSLSLPSSSPSPSASSSWRTDRLRTAVQTEASSWLADLRVVVRRVHDDTDITRERVFGALWPLLVFGTLFVLCVIALKPGSFLHHIIVAPREHRRELAVFGGSLVGGLTAGLLTLRTAVWCIAEGSAAFIAIDKKKNTPQLPSSNVLLGAMFR